MLERYGVPYSSQSSDIRKKIIQTTLDHFGVENPMQNSDVRSKSMSTSSGTKSYNFPSRTIQCQGYEPWALDILLEQYDEYDIITDDEFKYFTDEFPEFWYMQDGKKHRYFPDIGILSEKKIIEVKSDYTATLDPEKISLKMKSVTDLGFNMELWVFTEKKELTIY